MGGQYWAVYDQEVFWMERHISYWQHNTLWVVDVDFWKIDDVLNVNVNLNLDRQAALNLNFAIPCLKFQIRGIELEVMSRKFESRLLESQVYNRKCFCDEICDFWSPLVYVHTGWVRLKCVRLILTEKL